MSVESLGTGLAYYIAFLFSVTLHEAAHAWAAKLGGDLTAYEGGQVSLDPVPHIRREPFGMVILPLVTALFFQWPWGYASAPFNRQWAVNHPRRAGWIALAGPASNLGLMLAAGLLVRAGMAAGVLYMPPSLGFDHIVAGADGWHGVAFMLSVFFSLNLVLAVLNLIPVPPLDGSTVVLLLLTPAAGRGWLRVLWTNPMLGWIGLLVAWNLFPAVFAPVFFGILSVLYLGTPLG